MKILNFLFHTNFYKKFVEKSRHNADIQNYILYKILAKYCSYNTIVLNAFAVD